MGQLVITNAKVILPDAVIPKSTVVVKGKRIAAILKRKKRRGVPAGSARIDARGNYLAPGFIDLHIHGDIGQISRQQARGGTCAFLATLHPQRPKDLLEEIAQVVSRKKGLPGAKILGLRLEGPFLNRAFCGALPPEFLRTPDIAEAKRLIKMARGVLKMVVLAPELKGAEKLIRLLRRHKIVASIGHTDATYEQAKRGIAAGACHATHTFNRMRSFDHRDPGALGAVLQDRRVFCEVIPEENHVHPAALQLLARCKGLDKTLLVTDSTQAQEKFGKKRCGDVFRLKNGTLYGTALTLNKALKKAIRFLGLSLPQALRLVTLNPAKVLGIDRRKGSIAVGKDADLAIFDRDFQVKMTIVEGKIVYKKGSCKLLSNEVKANVRYHRIYR